jgi:hypothetical protein
MTSPNAGRLADGGQDRPTAGSIVDTSSQRSEGRARAQPSRDILRLQSAVVLVASLATAATPSILMLALRLGLL